MNYSESTKRRNERKRRFRQLIIIVLITGIAIGFIAGYLTGHAWAKAPEEVVVETVTPEPTIQPLPTQEPITIEPVTLTFLGTYRITAYCSCEICCGEWANNRPNGIVTGAAGTELIPGVSCAAPLPFGTVLQIDGLGEYVVQDRTASWVAEKYDNHIIDIYFNDHDAARQFGVKNLDVYVKGEAPNDQM